MTSNVVPVIAVDSVFGLASRHGREEAFLTLSNYTDKSYTVSWADYDGVLQPREPNLEAFGVFAQRTYATHPFVLIDEDGSIRFIVEPVKGNCIAYLEPDEKAVFAPSKLIELTPQPKKAHNPVRSLKSDHTCLLIVSNTTEREFRLLWLDFDGEREEYQIIKAGETTTQSTYETHPWLLAEVGTDKEFLYLPQRGVCRIVLKH